MPIRTAQRFKYLDEETNSPIEKFEKMLDSSIWNYLGASGKELARNLEQLINTMESAPEELLKKIEELGPVKALKEITRETKGLFDKIMSLAGLEDNILDKVLGEVIADPESKKNVRQLVRSCRSAAGGMGNVGKPFKPTTACSSGKSRPLKPGCDSEGFAKSLEKLTGGTFKNTIQTPNKDLRKLITLAGSSYNLGLCGGYSSVSKGMDKRVRAKGAAGLLSMNNARQNALGTIDVTKGSVGLQPKNYYPGVVSDFLNDFQTPLGIREKDWTQLGQKVTATAELLDSKWNVSDYDTSPSLKSMSRFSQDLGNAFDSVRTNVSFASSQLNDVVKQADTFVTSAYSIVNKVNSKIDKVSSFGKKLSKWF